MPDLGIYAFAVLSSYAVSLILLAAIIGASWISWRRIKRQLEEVESRNG